MAIPMPNTVLLSEKKVWDIVEGETLSPRPVDEHTAEEQAGMTTSARKIVEMPLPNETKK